MLPLPVQHLYLSGYHPHQAVTCRGIWTACCGAPSDTPHCLPMREGEKPPSCTPIPISQIPEFATAVFRCSYCSPQIICNKAEPPPPHILSKCNKIPGRRNKRRFFSSKRRLFGNERGAMRQGKRNGWLANGSSECFAVNGVCCETRNRGDAVMLAEPIEGWQPDFRFHAPLRARA